MIRLLGQGAFGRVWLGFDDELRRQVAVKVPAPERFQRPEDAEVYLAEARVVAGLDHPHIVPVYDVGRAEDGSVYIVSKFIEGGNLAERIARERPSPDTAAAWLSAVARALHHAHQKRLIHRDIKPANILFDDAGGTPYVADFGLAIDEDAFLRDGGHAGTPAYMSPEQARGEGHRLDGRSDVYALGVVMYELLTGKRPFRGATKNELLHQTVSVDPAPPRSLDAAISAEMERICLKALAKRASDRYATAAEMADDLEQRSREQTMPAGDLPIVPKGLRSFDADDADFFLQLLPGARNRDGLPESIQFWKTRLEATDAEQTFGVGLIYGPSGCGKSSLVKAGLLPRLSADVVAMYVEATPDDTETRVLRGLRKLVPDLPGDSPVAGTLRVPCPSGTEEVAGDSENLSEGGAPRPFDPDTARRSVPATLVETFAFLRRREGKKIVVVLDQFEQWLHAHRAERRSELIDALRQCDGAHVQAVVMVRDDFAMAAARFMDALDIPIVQGRNFATVDLFDIEHAEKVLAKFGQAFGKLPAQSTAFSNNEQQFLAAVAAGLAQDGKVVSVRLALFAEMVKSKPWTPATLAEVGGTAGVGVNFLEETFASRAANPKHRQHQQAARAVLRALLPEVGADIKGHMRSHAELLAASGYGELPPEFRELLRILDGELRLITPTDPEGFQTDSDSDPTAKFYQLTHDYLVPSLREWLTRKQRETRRGRAELRLAERSALWNSKPDNRQLPSLWEFLNIRLLTERKQWTPTQHRMMRRAGRVQGVRAGLAAAALVALTFGGLAVRKSVVAERERVAAENLERQNETRAEGLVAGLLQADIAQVPKIIDELAPYRRWADPLLQSRFAVASENSPERLKAALALLPVDAGQVEYVYGRLIAAEPEEIVVVRDALAPHQAEISDRLWKLLEPPTAGRDQQVLCAAAALAWYAPDDLRWEACQADVADKLAGVSPFFIKYWLDALRDASDRLIAPLATIHSDTARDANQRLLATNILADYAADQPAMLAELLMAGDAEQFAVIYPKFKERGESVSNALIDEIARKPPADADENAKERLALRQAKAGAALLKLNRADEVWPLLKHAPDPRARTYLIHAVAPLGVDPGLFIRRFDEEADVSVRRALLLSLGEYDQARLPPAAREPFLAKLQDIYQREPDAGLHAAAQWLLRTWGQKAWLAEMTVEWTNDDPHRAERLKTIDKQLASREASAPAASPLWYVNKQGQTMVVVPGPIEFLMGSPETEPGRSDDETLHQRQIGRTFAIASTEVTKAQFAAFQAANRDVKKFNVEQYSRTDDSPQVAVDWYDAARYCNWLSKAEGLPETEWCYEPNAAGGYAEGMKPAADYLKREGYRLPTEAEWECACRSEAVTSRHYGLSVNMLPNYARFRDIGDTHAWPVGELKPNDFGMFDMQGNAFEWCDERYGNYPDGEVVRDSGDSSEVQDKVSRVLRGGSFNVRPSNVHSSFRYFNLPTARRANIGFRVARTYN